MLRVLTAFDSERLEYVLIGAAAMGIHGLVRATAKADFPPGNHYAPRPAE
jgi:hypothetical protein